MRILALEPYYGGSHRALLDGWSANSGHQITVLGLPAHNWKWRMRHAALTLAEQAQQLLMEGASFEVLWASDMLNLPEFVGLAPPELAQLPRVVYFHENQLTYPDDHRHARDYHFAFTNFLSAAAADAVWFNSQYHRTEFLAAMGNLLRRMPDHRPLEVLSGIEQRSTVIYPGIESPPATGLSARDAAGPLHILWAARWEHDKNPSGLLAALIGLSQRQVDFRLSVIGESFQEVPPEFAAMERLFGERIVKWGYQPTRTKYWRALTEADVFVSTANHDFFGIAAVEAVRAGAFPVLPQWLAYPEVFGLAQNLEREQFFYDGTIEGLIEKLIHLAERKQQGHSLENDSHLLTTEMKRLEWVNLAAQYDDAISCCAEKNRREA